MQDALHCWELLVYFLIEIFFGVIDCLFGVSAVFDLFSKSKENTVAEDEVIDPGNSFHVGYLVGLKGGAITDAAAVPDTLERFQQTHGRKPTLRDAKLVVGLFVDNDRVVDLIEKE